MASFFDMWLPLKIRNEQLIKLQVGEKYNFKNQPERLVYLGDNFSGNGYWHQFAKTEEPEVVWSEMQDSDLHMIELTQK